MTKTTERIRTTISVDKEVHQVFVRMAEAAGMSVSRCMGEWLADTVDGAEFVALKMEEARKSPKLVMREMQSMAAGMVDLANETIAKVRKVKAPMPDALAAPRSVPSRSKAPSSNTGLYSPNKSSK
jgi:hypothetical protein